MTALNDAPLSYDFGTDFNYDLWDENTVLTLVNVPWNNDYRDIVRFANPADRDAWINGEQNVTISDVSFQKFAQNVIVDLPYNAALRFNYLRASNGLQPITGDVQRNYYYFVTGVNYLAPDATQLTLQVDVWQTFGYEITFGSCYVERGHIGIANTNAFTNYGRDYLNVPEGLDVGGEYRIVKTAREPIMGVSPDIANANYSILVCTIVDLSKPTGDYSDPALYTATGSVVDGIVSGASFYVFPTADDFRAFLTTYSDKSWITQGVISVTIIPKMSRYHGGVTLNNVAPDTFEPLPAGTSGPPTAIPATYTMYEYPAHLPAIRDTALAPNWRDTLLNLLPARYRALKKLLTYPYSLIEITTWTGQPLVARPEAWADDDATIREQAVMMPPGQRIALIPYRYNADSNTTATVDDDSAEYLDFATTIDRFPTVPIVNNMAINFLASNNAGLAFQFSSADWSQQRALRGNELSYRQATAGMNLQGEQASIAERARSEQAVNASAMAMGHGLTNGVASIAGGMASGSPIGGAIGGASAATGAMINMQGMTAAAQIANSATQASTVASIGTGSYVRDTNKDMADFSARGNYANTIAGINAKIQDARMIQPSTSGQFGGDAMNLAHSHTEVAARWKMLDDSALRTVGNYWLRYGYAVHQFIDFPTKVPENLLVMQKFTYWQLSETYISQGNFPEGFKQAIRGIFEKGVTIWANPADIGRIDWADNLPLEGVSY